MRLPLTVLAVASALMAAVRAWGDVDVHINVGPPPPAVAFETEPQVVLIPQTHVYYVPVVTQYDMYLYGKYWYINRDGHWYRSHGYRGPFKLVPDRHLPRAVVVVPGGYGHQPRHPRKHLKPGKKHPSYDDDD